MLFVLTRWCLDVRTRTAEAYPVEHPGAVPPRAAHQEGATTGLAQSRSASVLQTAPRARVASAPPPPTTSHGGILAKLVAEAGGPEVQVPQWPAARVPPDIVRTPPCCGVFPRVEHYARAEELGRIAALGGGAGRDAFRNCESFEERRALAAAELARERDRGRPVRAATREELDRQLGALPPSRMAAIVEAGGDLRKVRLLRDLRGPATARASRCASAWCGPACSDPPGRSKSPLGGN